MLGKTVAAVVYIEEQIFKTATQIYRGRCINNK